MLSLSAAVCRASRQLLRAALRTFVDQQRVSKLCQTGIPLEWHPVDANAPVQGTCKQLPLL
jgi:hypothetical protein